MFSQVKCVDLKTRQFRLYIAKAKVRMAFGDTLYCRPSSSNAIEILRPFGVPSVYRVMSVLIPIV